MNKSTHSSPALRRLLGIFTVVAALLVGVLPAHADREQPRVVSEHPVDWTPHLLDGTVYAITTVGDTVVVGGSFTAATDAARRVRYDRQYLLAFRAGDGRVSRFQARLDGPVHALAPGPDGTVYVGGSFQTVNGERQRGVTQLRLDTGERVPQFRASVNWGTVRSMVRREQHLYIGGTFSTVNGEPRAGLARLHYGNGALDPAFDPQLALAGGRAAVHELAVTEDGRRLVVVGAFSHAAGARRAQVALFDTSGREARLSEWYTDAYERPCARVFRNSYVRGVDFAPDGSYFVVVTTGGRSHPDELCDTAARFDVTGTGRHGPAWVNHTGGHSLYSVAITGPAVYVGGHERWHDNPHGWKAPGPGAVPREGIAALHPETGKALPWNPGRARGVGVQDFHATEDGLYVGSDTTRLGGVYRGRLGMFPLD
ncbi:MAG TPA: delta-60 repeat domain-containing protein [Natronosporangium sp.]